MIIAAKDQFSSKFKLATSMVSKLGGAAKSVAKVVTGLMVAVTAAAAAFVALGKKAFDALDDVGKTADRTGIAAEKIQALRLAAVESGASVEDLNKGLEKFAKNIGDVVVKGTGEATYALDRMGIQLRNNSGHLKTNDQLLKEVVEGIGKLGQESERASILQSMFGRAGIKMNQVFGEGAEAFDAWIQKAEEMGFVVSGKTIKAVESFNDRFSELQFIASGLVNQTFAALSPMLDTLITNFRDWIIEINKTKGGLADLGKAIAGELVEGLATVIETFGSVIKWFKETSLWITHISDSIKALGNLNPLEIFKDFQRINQEYQDGLKKLTDYDAGTKSLADALRALFKNSTDAKGGIDGVGDSTDNLTDNLSTAAESLTRFGNGFDLVFNNGKEQFEDMEKLGTKVANTLETGLTDAFMNLQAGAESLKDVMDNILKQIMAELIRVFIVQRAVGAVKTFFGFPGKASGGPVTGGRTYMVGERGPELFTPPGNGNIVPNHQLAAVGGGETNINITYDIKAFNAKDATAAIAEQAPTIVGIVEQSFRKRGKRGPLGA